MYQDQVIDAFYELASLEISRKAADKAIYYINQAIFLCRKNKKIQNCRNAKLLSLQGRAFHVLKDYKSSENNFKDAILINENIYGNKFLYNSFICQWLGDLYIDIDDYASAENILKKSVDIIENTIGKSSILLEKPLLQLAIVYYNAGQYFMAEQELLRRLHIQENFYGKFHHDIASTLSNLGILYSIVGNYNRSFQMYERALHIVPKIGAQGSLLNSNILLGLAEQAYHVGDFYKARELCDQAMMMAWTKYDLKKDRSTSLAMADTIQTFGFFAATAGLAENANKKQTLSFGQGMLVEALKIRFREGQTTDDTLVREAMSQLGNVYLRQGEIEKARGLFIQVGELIGQGRCSLATGQYIEAREFFTEASKDKIKETQIAAQIGLGLSLEGVELYEEASEHFRQAIQLIENQWYTLNPGEKGTFLDGFSQGFKRAEAYMGMIRILVKLREQDHKAVNYALEYVERTKSRALLSLVASKDALVNTKEEPEVLQEAREFLQKLYAAEVRMSLIASRGEHLSIEYIEQAQKDYQSIKKQHDTFFAYLQSTEPELASLVSLTEPVKTETIQALLKKGEALIEYAYYGADAWAWVVKSDSVQVKRLEISEEEIQQSLAELNLWEKNVQHRGVVTVSFDGQPEGVPDERQEDTLPASSPEALAHLFGALIEPVQPWLEGVAHVIIVPYGALHRLPFSALYDGENYLIDHYSLVQVPSASVLQYMATKRNPDNGKLLAFANPASEKPALPYAEPEVEEIAPLFSYPIVYTKKEATESRVKEAVQGQDVVHFACHGFFNSSEPLRSALFFGKDEKNDGILDVSEIFQLNLQEANLVTLSACETASAKVQGGDDVVGLSRGFLYAGSPSLLATLWQVDDRSVSLLMQSFYDNWRTKGLNKAESLRRAQRSLKEDRRYGSPYYWAPFVLIGDWNM